jgi:DeoR family suf operon transcriptional repressor
MDEAAGQEFMPETTQQTGTGVAGTGATGTESSDVAVMDLLCKVGSVTVNQLAAQMDVTATAVRQRLNRMMGQGLIERKTERSGRGRPSHQYQLTEKGRRKTGANFSDLAIALWQEIRHIQDASVKRGLLQRLAATLAEAYSGQVNGATPEARMRDIQQIFAERNVPFSVNDQDDLPVLTAEACPYPALAEQDRSICAMEKLLFSNLIEQDVRLTSCRLDGANCCTFEMS